MSNLGLEQSLAEMASSLLEPGSAINMSWKKWSGMRPIWVASSQAIRFYLITLATGDGLLTSLKMLEIMVERGQSLSELVKGFRLYPQILINLRSEKRSL